MATAKVIGSLHRRLRAIKFKKFRPGSTRRFRTASASI
ncbi:hypothetical protein T261_8038 [Streptomyces lydicus]|nr:hypothetical protein T261_8038 [Streptomyces lydicus]